MVSHSKHRYLPQVLDVGTYSWTYPSTNHIARILARTGIEPGMFFKCTGDYHVPSNCHESWIDAVFIFHVVGNIQSDFELENLKLSVLHREGYRIMSNNGSFYRT